MKVLLIDIDSTIPNLALHKVAKFHEDKGDEVVWDMPLFAYDAEKVYVSCIFPENRDKCLEWEGSALIGGTGYSLKITLPDEIESIKPKINWGFTTRGCIRKCHFCFVPEKEGNIRVVGDVYDLWDGKSKELYIMDNNILALPNHFMKIAEQLQTEKLRVDFNQGLDHRLLTAEICRTLLSLKHIHEIRFAYDHISYKPTVERTLSMLKDCGLRDWGSRWYVYVSPKDNFKNVYERLNLLHKRKQNAYLMRDRNIYDKPEFVALAKWVNSGFFKIDFEEIINHKAMSSLKKYAEEMY